MSKLAHGGIDQYDLVSLRSLFPDPQMLTEWFKMIQSSEPVQLDAEYQYQ